MARSLALAAACLAMAAGTSFSPAQEKGLDTARIERITGLKGAFFADEGVFKVSSPRTDVKVRVSGRPLAPFMGLASWAGFLKEAGGRTMAMGDLALFQDEVNPAMSELLGAGIEVTALHNHFFFDEPRVFFMHFSAEGGEEALAAAVRRALDRVKAVRAAEPIPAASSAGRPLPASDSITADPIREILGAPAESKDGMVKVVIGRKATASCGCEMGREMGVNTWAAFAGSDDDAAVDGDFVVLERELQPVLKALRGAGIDIVAIHNHMTGETPRLIFLHYRGRGKAADLARAVKGAIDVTAR